VGDDIAWLRIDDEGNLRAVNPEAGVFGVAPGTNSKTNPNAMATVKKNAIYTNVLLKNDKSVWWEGMDGDVPSEGWDWKGQPWHRGQLDSNGKASLGAHPNSRFTAPIAQCPSLSKKFSDPRGVKISAIIFGGRRARLTPLVFEARSWQHGVYLGATMSSERTAAQFGKVGELRRDPMAMIPFCGYNMGTYFQHWLEMGKNLASPPRIFHVNWFKQDENGKYLWPGYGENLRVLLWMIDRCRYQKSATETAIGSIPNKGDLDLTGLNLSAESWEQLFEIDQDEWRNEIEDQKKFFGLFGPATPREIWAEQKALSERLGLQHTASSGEKILQPV
jgi:phosphoenolpyruvate carboxykinase (GTP)